MDATRRDSRANLALIAELETMGVPGVTSRQLERWRQASALPGISRESHGRAGTATRWPPSTAAQAKALVGLLGRRVPLRRCPLALFALGYPLDAATLRAGYLDLYEEISTALAGPSGDGAGTPDPLDRADAVAQAVVRRAGRGFDLRLTGLDDFAGFFDESAILARTELIPVFLTLATPEWTAALAEQLRQLRAFAAISADLPEVFGPTALHNREAMTEPERKEATTLVAKWLSKHPGEAAALEPLWNSQ